MALWLQTALFMIRVRTAFLVLALSLARSAHAVPLLQSQQFTAMDARPVTANSPGPLDAPPGERYLRLDADVLLLSAGRIRELLLRELGLPREGGGRIRLVLFMASKPDELIRMVSTLSPDGWDYEVDVPDQVEEQRFVRGIVSSLLLEIANRGQGPKTAELPIWMVEGLSTQVLAVGGPDLLVTAVPLGTMRRVVRETPLTVPGKPRESSLDYLRGARELLREGPKLNFTQLAYPRNEWLVRDKLKYYQAAAQLFVYELLHLPKGPSKLVSMLRSLPGCWNWETALLSAFTPDFGSILDVEKRWAVDLLAFVAHDPAQVWSKLLCLEHLNEVLSVAAQVRQAPDVLPERRTLTLQQVITNWTFAVQAPVLRQKVALLSAMRFNANREVVPLIDAYAASLASYLQKRFLAGKEPETRMQATYNASLVARDAIRELEALDQRRKAMRPEEELSVNSPTSPSR
jgi:hypothetical protein